MASHHQRNDEILPFGQPTDAPAPRYVRPIPEEQIGRVDCYQAFRDAELEVANRKFNHRVAVALALLSCIVSIYFIAELLRAATH